jgi:trk system potassium uptake protein TrkA
MLDKEGHKVTVVDMVSDAFQRLGERFQGRTILGVGIDMDILRQAGIEGADAFLAVTNGDNTNILAAQIAKVKFSIPRVLARIYDPLRARIYRELGIETLCMTTLGAGLLFDRLFERPLQDLEHYLKLTEATHGLYAADLPTPAEVKTHRASGEGQPPRYIIVAGGGKVGYQLARTLLQQDYEVLLVEKRRDRYQLLHEELGEAVWLGDVCEIRTMVRIGMERADLVVAVTGDDEDNLVICQVAKGWFGVPRTVSRINSPGNEEIFRDLGVGDSVSATTLMFQLIQQEVAPHDLVPLVLLRHGKLEVLETDLARSSPAVGKPVRELSLPVGCLLGAVVRGTEAHVVTGDTVLQVGDTVVALAAPDAVPALRQALRG